MTLRFSDVFVPGGFPRHTYNPRADLHLERQLLEAKENLCKLVTITGQTKSGKTVLTRRVFPREESCWIDGGSISEENDFWNIIIDELELFTGKQVQVTGSDTIGISGTASGEASFLIAKASATITPSYSSSDQTSSGETRNLSPKIVALAGLKESMMPVIVDDFHYLPIDLQGKIVRALKPLIFDGLPVIIIAIPHRRYDAIKVEREMTGRIHQIQIPSWSFDELNYIATTGFTLLGRSIKQTIINILIENAIGSPHLMQEFCREICKSHNIIEVLIDNPPIEIADFDPGPIFNETAESIGRPIFEKLARGPRQRTDRIDRTLKNGNIVDIYELVLHALSHLKPGLTSLEYEELRAAIREISIGGIPQLHEVSRVLKHMATIAATDQSSTPVIDFDDTDKRLHITDPFFAFYLRWGSLHS